MRDIVDESVGEANAIKLAEFFFPAAFAEHIEKEGHFIMSILILKGFEIFKPSYAERWKEIKSIIFNNYTCLEIKGL